MHDRQNAPLTRLEPSYRVGVHAGHPRSRMPRVAALLLLVVAALGTCAQTASAQDEYIGTITLVPYNFAMRGYADCNGQILSISQNTALFSILGTTYGGNGQTTFALPNLNGRTPIGVGQGPGLTARVLGESGGSPTVTLTAAQMPAHTHAVQAGSGAGTESSPEGTVYAANAAGVPAYQTGSNGARLLPTGVAATGGGQPHNNWQPYLGLKWVICITGVFPPRN
jgi:microcystin-dependent protein